MICTSPWNHLAKMSVAAFLISIETTFLIEFKPFPGV